MTRERRASVLLVDDEPDNLVALTAVLEPLDRELVQAGSGEEALKLLLAREFAVILLDVRMPGLDGIETARMLTAKRSDCVVVLVSGHEVDDVRALGERVGRVHGRHHARRGEDGVV